MKDTKELLDVIDVLAAVVVVSTGISVSTEVVEVLFAAVVVRSRVWFLSEVELLSRGAIVMVWPSIPRSGVVQDVLRWTIRGENGACMQHPRSSAEVVTGIIWAQAWMARYASRNLEKRP